jgi:hypothetical protein
VSCRDIGGPSVICVVPVDLRLSACHQCGAYEPDGDERATLEAIHSQIGGAVTNAMILIMTLGCSLLGVRRERFSRA